MISSFYVFYQELQLHGMAEKCFATDCVTLSEMTHCR